MGRAGITRKTFLFAAWLIILVTLVSFAILYFAMPLYYQYKREQNLQREIAQLKKELQASTDQAQCAALIGKFSEACNVTVTSFNAEGLPIFRLTTAFIPMTGVQAEDTPELIEGAAGREELASSLDGILTKLQELEGSLAENSGHLEEQQLYFQFSADGSSDLVYDEVIGTPLVSRIHIEGSLQPIDEARWVILSLMPYVLAAGCLIGLCLAWFYARQITKPILKLSVAAKQMKQMEPHVVSGIRSNDELGQLSAHMDSLYQSLIVNIEKLQGEMDKVCRLEQSKTEMMQSAGHELKTPIAALSGMLDGMLDQIGVYKDRDKYLLKCREQVEKLSLLVREILEAARADGIGGGNGQPVKSADTEIDELISYILAEHESGIREKALIVETKLDRLVISTNQDLLYRAMSNLIGNAVTYTPECGRICMKLEDGILDISNDCEPIPEAELPKLFEPFYTRSSSRDRSVSGTGLGLYIVKRNLEKLSLPYELRSTKTGFLFKIYFSLIS